LLLVLDIGNTNVTLGVFDGPALKSTWRLATDARRMPDEYGFFMSNIMSYRGVQPSDITGACICSVVPPLIPTFEEVCRNYFAVQPLTVSAGVKTGISIQYDSPRDVGTDRVADAVAALKLYGGPVIVVDFGTATVFDAVSADGKYLGGALAPGINLSADALYQSTSQLRRVELVPPATAIGKNTVAAMQSGLIFGYIGLVEGMVARFKSELGPDAKVIATGGLAELMARETTVFDAVNPDLTLLGLRMIYDLNLNKDGRDKEEEG
jgi:type III pantothenate kinase